MLLNWNCQLGETQLVLVRCSWCVCVWSYRDGWLVHAVGADCVVVFWLWTVRVVYYWKSRYSESGTRGVTRRLKFST